MHLLVCVLASILVQSYGRQKYTGCHSGIGGGACENDDAEGAEVMTNGQKEVSFPAPDSNEMSFLFTVAKGECSYTMLLNNCTIFDYRNINSTIEFEVEKETFSGMRKGIVTVDRTSISMFQHCVGHLFGREVTLQMKKHSKRCQGIIKLLTADQEPIRPPDFQTLLCYGVMIAILGSFSLSLCIYWVYNALSLLLTFPKQQQNRVRKVAANAAVYQLKDVTTNDSEEWNMPPSSGNQPTSTEQSKTRHRKTKPGHSNSQ